MGQAYFGFLEEIDVYYERGVEETEQI